jgi:hypothetical protein
LPGDGKDFLVQRFLKRFIASRKKLFRFLIVKAKTTISKAELETILQNVKGNTFATITTSTEPAQVGSSPFKTTLRKISRVNVALGFIYSNSVSNQEKREGLAGNFEAQPRKWGVRVAGTPLVTHKGKTYIEAKVERSIGHGYLVEGRRTAKATVSPFLRPTSKPSTQAHIEKPVILRDYSLDNILRIRMGGRIYNIR